MHNEQEKYPLCIAAGIDMNNHSYPAGPYIYADQVERLLSSAPVVSQYTTEGIWHTKDISAAEFLDNDYTHRARLFLIEPIVRESEERRLLREFVKALDHTSGGLAPWAPTLHEAKALLAKAGEPAP